MQPESVRSEDVVARVVAWHNRHPLATRITPAQVHSVGVVSLPYAVTGARVAPLPQASEPASESAAERAAEPAATSTPAGGPTGAPPADPAAGGADTLVELVTDPEPDPAPAAAAPAGPHDETPQADRQAVTLTAADAAAAAEASPEPAQPAPVRPMTLRRQVTLPASDPGRGLRRLSRGLRDIWLRLRGRHPYRALFSEDFIAPLSPRRVAAFATRHGRPEWPLEPEAPLRLVTLDPQRRRGGDEAPELDLHLITAAVGVGEQRLRVLIGAGPAGAVIGPRHWSRARLAAAGAPLSLLLVGALASVLLSRPAHPGAAPQVAASTESVASAASGAAPPAPGAVAHTTVAAASAPASAATGHAEATHAEHGVPGHPAHATLAVHVAAPAPGTAASNAPAPGTAAANASAEVPPVSVGPTRGRIDLPPLVPRLAGGERQALRQAAVVLRGPYPQAAPAKAWALATRPLTDRGQSERARAQLKALALLYRMPMQAELMQAGGAWRAVFWPFTNADDAEKVRLALADKGLKTEVIEF